MKQLDKSQCIKLFEYLHKIGLAFRLDPIFKMYNITTFDIRYKNDKLVLFLPRNTSAKCKKICMKVVSKYNKQIKLKPKETELKLEMEEV